MQTDLHLHQAGARRDIGFCSSSNQLPEFRRSFALLLEDPETVFLSRARIQLFAGSRSREVCHCIDSTRGGICTGGATSLRGKYC